MPADTAAPAHPFVAPHPAADVASIRAIRAGSEVEVSADGPTDTIVDGEGPGGLDDALGRYAETLARQAGVGAVAPAPAPALWCS